MDGTGVIQRKILNSVPRDWPGGKVTRGPRLACRTGVGARLIGDPDDPATLADLARHAQLTARPPSDAALGFRQGHGKNYSLREPIMIDGYLLYIGGIKSESTDEKHMDCIEF